VAPAASTHWEDVYASGDAGVSWIQAHAGPSLAAIAATGLPRDAPIVDVGGGSSVLAGELLAAGHTDVTVLDLSATAMRLARDRLGDRGAAVEWIVADLLAWRPARRYALWHDRAVLHFFTQPHERAGYADTLRAALAPGGFAIVATFAPDGPTTCSGLPVQRSSAEEVLGLLGDGFDLVDATTERHVTPRGSMQPFSRLVARRHA
jgi:trans-aconitate methyltransferase